MFRRQPFDKVNPRNVMPSRHTIFIRGLPGSTDVGKVKEYFSSETNSKCSIDFFSTSDDRKRLSVAIRFKSNDMAREMLNKYNNGMLMGHPVELTWFKDLKKARAKMFEEQRQGGGRSFQRPGFRGNFRGGQDRRGIVTSPNNYDNGRRGRAGSSSSGGGPDGTSFRGNMEKRYSQSRSRSFTGSSSRSGSVSGHSRSRSHSRNRQMPTQGVPNSSRGLSGGQPLNNRHSRKTARSVSGSSSSSRSSNARLRQSSTSRAMSGHKMRYQHGRGNASPLNYAEPTGNDFSSFSNAPAPEADGGSSLVSGLIQLNRRSQLEPEPRLSRRTRRSSIGSSSSGMSRTSARGNFDQPNNSLQRGTLGKRLRSLSPPFTETSQRNRKLRPGESSPEQTQLDENRAALSKRRRSKRDIHSPLSRSPSSTRHANMSGSATRDSVDRQRESSFDRSANAKGARRVDADLPRRMDFGKSNRVTDHEPNSFEEDVRSRSAYDRRADRQRSPVSSSHWKSSDGSVGRDGVSADSGGVVRSSHRSTRHREPSVDDGSSASDVPDTKHRRDVDHKNVSKNESKSKTQVSADENSHKDDDHEPPIDPVDLIRQRKESLAQDYKRDCEAFTIVVRTLISKDAELESRLMPMLKEILHERGQRCIEELRTFIAENQPENESKIPEEGDPVAT